MLEVRPPAVAGLFYPGRAPELRAALGALIPPPRAAATTRPPKILIVPHAGYVYSGRTAGRAYALLAPFRAQITRVVMLGPAHRVWVRGAAIPTVDSFATPLGDVPLDRAVLAWLRTQPDIVESDAAHAAEHALEVQLPFLQTVLDRFTLVPLAVGDLGYPTLADVLAALWGGDETLIVVSSDLSHYHRYEVAQTIDRATVDRILALDDGIDHDQACGATPINAALLAAKGAHLRPRLLELCNSGDTAGDRDRVVGYCAIAFEGEFHARH
ncbi:MAG TPA: AmmeMemoRadiSam system protein B [Burkholderiaceae bacterium]|jgi:AmmeMemoRadiSam system protein B|nr:AmmeMemoRadiSam system protein B [Burkholderiaceae bacterium]